MSDLQQLIGAVHHMLPSVHVDVDEPDAGTCGSTFVMFDLRGHAVDLEWRPGRGFGVSSTEETPALGEGPEEVYEDWTQAAARIANLLAFQRRTVPRTGPTRQIPRKKTRENSMTLFQILLAASCMVLGAVALLRLPAAYRGWLESKKPLDD